MAKNKSLKLNLDLDFLENIYVLGIQAPLFPVYQLAYFLNRDAHWNLTRLPEDYTAGHHDTYAVLQHELPADHLNIFLLENKNPKPLVPAENCDYFLIAGGEVDHYDFKTLKALLENMPSVFSVYRVEADQHPALVEFFLTNDCFPAI